MANSISAIITGRTDSHIASYPHGNVGVHKEVVGALNSLHTAAKEAGFELSLCSGFRNFETQLRIWNEKCSGKRPVLDAQSRPLKIDSLTPAQLIMAILRWSALPGMSRHHWGTDFDVYDLSRMPKDYKLKLIPEEFVGDGFFRPLHDWLDKHMARFGFFRPYATDRGGVSPERWHLSFSPLSQKYWNALKVDEVKACLSQSNLIHYPEVEAYLPEIYEKFFKRIDLP